MAGRLLTAAAAVVLALTVLAWPLSRLGVGVVAAGAGVERSAWVAEGALRLDQRDLPPPKPLDRERYEVRLGRPPDRSRVVVPLWPLLLGSGAAVGAIVGVAWRRVRARLRRGECPACGHPRPTADGPCQECGLGVEEARARAWSRPVSRLAGDAGAGLFLAMLALSAGMWMVVRAEERAASVHRTRALDYSWYLQACTPRLTGDVLYATPGPGPQSLDSALQLAAPGTTIVLLPGRHDVGDLRQGGPRAIKDLWLLGSGRGTTTLTMQYAQVEAVRIEGVTIECADSPMCDIRDGGSLHLRDCLVRGYNSGAGGSDAIFSSGSALLIESCEFEGRSGRAAAMLMRGKALDLREGSRVFIRDSRFVDNQSVFREADGVLDRCTAMTDQPQYFSGPGGRALYVRGSAFGEARRWGVPPVACTEMMDDLGSLERLAAGEGVDGAWEDPAVRAAARELRLGRGTALWGRLLLHPDPAVRKLAVGRVPLPAADAGMTLEEAAAELGGPILKRSAALAILGAGEAGRQRMEEVARAGSESKRAAAAALLQLMGAQPSLPELVRAQRYRR